MRARSTSPHSSFLVGSHCFSGVFKLESLISPSFAPVWTSAMVHSSSAGMTAPTTLRTGKVDNLDIQVIDSPESQVASDVKISHFTLGSRAFDAWEKKTCITRSRYATIVS